MPYLPSPSATNVATPTSNKCPGQGKECYNCSSQNHYTTLCRHSHRPQQPSHNPRARSPRQAGRSPQRETRSRNNLPDNGCRSSHSPSRYSSNSQSHSPSHSHSLHCNQSPRRHRRTTPFQCHQDSIKVIPAPSQTDSVETPRYPKEDSLLMECAFNCQVLFYTHLMLPTKNRMKSMTVKIEPAAQVNTIHLSRYQNIFPHKINKSRYPKQGTLIPTNHSLISHVGKPQPFLGNFITDVNYATQPRPYPIQFYVFQDATNHQILLLYVTSEYLGILEFKVPNLAVQSHIDVISVPNFPNPGSLRKTGKHITFWDP